MARKLIERQNVENKGWLKDHGWTDYHFRFDCRRSGCVPRMDLYEAG